MATIISIQRLLFLKVLLQLLQLLLKVTTARTWLLYHKCNKDMFQLDINQASEATISSVPLLPAPKVTIVFRKASYKNMQCASLVKKNGRSEICPKMCPSQSITLILSKNVLSTKATEKVMSKVQLALPSASVVARTDGRHENQGLDVKAKIGPYIQ